MAERDRPPIKFGRQLAVAKRSVARVFRRATVVQLHRTRIDPPHRLAGAGAGFDVPSILGERRANVTA
jgi:hypothetical protein